MSLSEANLLLLASLHREVLSSSRRPVDRLATLWRIGTVLQNNGIAHPHAIGAELQQNTGGVITRAVIFRAAKTRQIWPEVDNLYRDCKELRSIQYFYDIIALLDPKRKLNSMERQALLKAASSLSGNEFREFLRQFKKRVTAGQLGADRRTGRAKAAMGASASSMHALLIELETLALTEEGGNRFRSTVSENERSALSNMIIALATPRNLTLRREIGPLKSNSQLESFSVVYDLCSKMVRVKDDRERARLRSLVPGEEFERLAAVLQAFRSDEARERYLRTRGLAVNIGH